MSDYDDIMKPLMAGNIAALEEMASIVDDFPTGKDDFTYHFFASPSDAIAFCEWLIRSYSCTQFDRSS